LCVSISWTLVAIAHECPTHECPTIEIGGDRSGCDLGKLPPIHPIMLQLTPVILAIAPPNQSEWDAEKTKPAHEKIAGREHCDGANLWTE
jgi:hypothetical protein